MNHIYIPTSSSDDWRKFLAEPDKQWRSGYSAKELAECWEQANGFPAELQSMFSKSENQAFSKLELLLAIPEHKVYFPDGKRPSQNDLFVLARAKDGHLASIMIEGKVSEPFGNTLDVWLKNSSKGKKDRLKMLCEILDLPNQPPLNIRYQLFHRMASAIWEARRFNAKYALMIVHSFSPEHKWFSDYQDFLGLFDVASKINELVELPESKGNQIFSGWVVGKQKAG
jgi:hypothetical protein